MNQLLCLAVMASISLPCAAQTRDDRKQVDALPDRFSAAWARHDGHELAKIMAPDVDFVSVGAIWLHGADFETYHDRVLKGRFKASTNIPLERRTHFLRPDVAAIRWSWRIDGERTAEGKSLPPRHGMMLMIAQKRKGRWLVTDAQNTNAGPHRSEAEGLREPVVVPRNE